MTELTNNDAEAPVVSTEVIYFEALDTLLAADKTSVNAVTPFTRVALNRLLNEKSDAGLPTFSIDDVQQDLGNAYGFKSTASGKASKTLVPRAKQHFDGLSLIMRNIGTEGVLDAVNAFIDSPTPKKSTFNGLLETVRACITAKGKAKALANGVTEPEVDGEGEADAAPADAAPTVADVIARMRATIEALTVEQVAEAGDELVKLYDAIGDVWANAGGEVELAEAA